MEKNYHIFSNGQLKRDENTLVLVKPDGEKDHIPVNDVEAIFAHGQLEYNTKLLSFLGQNRIELNVFNWNGGYSGTFVPPKGQSSGSTVVSQVEAYNNKNQRSSIAREMVEASIHNMRRTLDYYNSDNSIQYNCDKLTELEGEVGYKNEIDEIMQVEGQSKKVYYDAINEIIPDTFDFEKRKYNPPSNEMNALISYCNSFLYASTTSAIRATALEPTISFLHEPGDRRQSLSLDIADIFKPVITDRVFLRILNRNQISKDDFREKANGVLLDESGRKVVTKEIEEQLEETIEHPKLNRHVSYQYLLRLEAYSLKKHILTGEEYDAFRRWW